MYIRRKKNKSGSTSIQVVDKYRGCYKVKKSIGIGITEAEFVLLERKARQYISEVTGLSRSLFEDGEDIFVEDFVSNLSNGQLQVTGSELIYGRLYDRIGYGSIQNEMFRHLVVTRLFSPGSKLKTIEYLQRYMGVTYDISSIYRFLDSLCYRKMDKRSKTGSGIKQEVEEISFAHTKATLNGKVDVVFHAMTTLFFEAGEEDDLRKTGFSKDDKHQCPQIYTDLLVACGGNPIGYDLFEGNIFEGNTFIPVLQKMITRFNLSSPVVIADAGLLSKKNIEALEKEHYEYILGARPKNETASIRQAILNEDLKDGGVIVISKNDTTRLVVSKSAKRAVKDKHNRERGLQRLQKRIKSGKLTRASINNRGYNKYLKIEEKVNVSIDMSKYEADTVWDGIKGYITNTGLKPEEVIEDYKNLSFIERCFRMNKTDLRIRPVYHRIRNPIEAHICICFTAYTVMLELERQLKASASSITLYKAQELVRTMYQLSYLLPKSKECHKQILRMDELQEELCRIIEKSCGI